MDTLSAMRLIVRDVLGRFGQQTSGNMKPYVVRLMQEIQNSELSHEEATDIRPCRRKSHRDPALLLKHLHCT